MSRPKLSTTLSLFLVLLGVATAILAAPGGAVPRQRATGLFILGDRTVEAATSADTVTFWSDSWWIANSLTFGPADSSFKGYAVDFSSPQPTCGDTWTTGPGNSPHPPDTVPSVITVVVTDTATKTANTISGDIVKVVQVATDPGYGPAPGHVGTGRIIATLCASDEL